MASGVSKPRVVSSNPRLVSDAAQVQQASDEVLEGFLSDLNQRIHRAGSDVSVVLQAMDELILALRAWKMHAEPAHWRHLVELCRNHPLCATVHQDPFTYRAFSKPRGYAGDAVMMDYIYGREEFWTPPEASPLGHQVFEYTSAAPAPEGVRTRRAWIARRIDLLAEEKPAPHVLAIAAGHLREVNLSAALRRNRVGRMVALDADAESLEEVARCYGRYGVETVPAKFRALLTGRCNLGEFDLVYSTGLFDYLDQRIGSRLVSAMFQMLRPGGKLVVANFLPDVRDIGYMETYMDWNLIYRSRREMVELTQEIPEEELRDVRLVSEENRNIIFLELIRN